MYHFLNLMMCRIENLNMQIHLYSNGKPIAAQFKVRDWFVPRNDKFFYSFPDSLSATGLSSRCK